MATPDHPATASIRRRPHHHPDDVATLRAERHAHADLLRALRHREGEQAVNADRRQHEGDDCERRQHAHLVGPGRRFEIHDLRQRLHFGDGQPRIGAMDDAVNRGASAAGSPIVRTASAFGA